MSKGVVIDANVIAQFVRLRLARCGGEPQELVERICQLYGLAIDEGKKIEQEWFDTCGSAFLKEWFASKLYDKSIERIKGSLPTQHRKKLLNEMGFPRDGYDLACVATANMTETKYIVTEDIDFYDPTLKLADTKAKTRAREQRCGAVCRYLRCELEIRVGMVAHASEDLFEAQA